MFTEEILKKKQMRLIKLGRSMKKQRSKGQTKMIKYRNLKIKLSSMIIIKVLIIFIGLKKIYQRFMKPETKKEKPTLN